MDLRASKINGLTSAFAFSLYQVVKNTKIISDFIILYTMINSLIFCNYN